MADGVRVEGMRELRRTLRAAGDDLGDLKQAHGDAARVAATASAALAPRGKTGNLKSSIRGAGTKTAGIIRAGKKSVPYAHAVHWGRKYWPNRMHARATPSKMDPQPFLSDGATGSEGQWIPIFERAVESALDKVKGA